MRTEKLLWDLLAERVHIPATMNEWHSVRCEVCHDHSPRCGFRYDGTYTKMNCFNCHAAFAYEEHTGNFSWKAKKYLDAFGITANDLQEISSTLFFNQSAKSDREITLETLRAVSLVTPEIKFPSRTLQIGGAQHEEMQEPIIEYLLSRNVDPYLFYFSLDPKHLRRVIIPFWRDKKLIYWQSRAIDDDVRSRYLNAAVAKDAVLYGYDKLFSYSDTPLFITEGVFDAISIDGICILGSSLSAAKIELLKKCRRRIIFVIDRDSAGSDLGAAVIRHGWELTFVDPNVDDVNHSISKYGKIYTVYSLMKNATNKSDRSRDAVLELGLELSLSRLRKSKYS